MKKFNKKILINMSNPTLESEWEKQSIIWSAFGVDYKRELQQLQEAKNTFLMQLNSSILTDEVREIIENVVRDEVKKLLVVIYNGKNIGGRGSEDTS